MKWKCNKCSIRDCDDCILEVPNVSERVTPSWCPLAGNPTLEVEYPNWVPIGDVEECKDLTIHATDSTVRTSLFRTVGTHDPVTNPSHYTEGRKYEPIDVIGDWGLDYHLGNALKYISRAGRKNDTVEDLKKAVWYIQREITKLERE